MTFIHPSPAQIRPAETARSQSLQATFTGSASEYFPIWLANILLTIITFGLYSPWAKVRRERYLLGHTWIGNSNFEYTADPVKIFKGRLIVGALFIAYTVLGNISVLLSGVLLVVIVLLLPWILVSSLRFRCRYTRYRGIHFQFTGSPGNAIMPMLIWKAIGGLTLGLAYPYAKFKAREFVVNHTAFGRTPFVFRAVPADFYRAYGLAVVTSLGIAALIALSLFLNLNVLLVLSVFLLYPFILAVWVGLRAYIARVTWHQAGIGEMKISFDISWVHYFFLVLVNAFAIVFSLGLATPWAAIRTYRYQTERLSLSGVQDLNLFVAATQQNLSSFADQASDIYDVDLEFGF